MNVPNESCCGPVSSLSVPCPLPHRAGLGEIRRSSPGGPAFLSLAGAHLPLVPAVRWEPHVPARARAPSLWLRSRCYCIGDPRCPGILLCRTRRGLEANLCQWDRCFPDAVLEGPQGTETVVTCVLLHSRPKPGVLPPALQGALVGGTARRLLSVWGRKLPPILCCFFPSVVKAGSPGPQRPSSAFPPNVGTRRAPFPRGGAYPRPRAMPHPEREMCLHPEVVPTPLCPSWCAGQPGVPLAVPGCSAALALSSGENLRPLPSGDTLKDSRLHR